MLKEVKARVGLYKPQLRVVSLPFIPNKSQGIDDNTQLRLRGR